MGGIKLSPKIITSIIVIILLCSMFPHIDVSNNIAVRRMPEDNIRGSEELSIEQETTYSGSLTGYYPYRLYAYGYLRIAIYRIYLSPGQHTIGVNPYGGDSGDDPGAIIYDPNGGYVNSGWGFNSLSLSFTATTSGYYFILVYLTDDDGGTLNAMRFQLYVDGSYICSGVVSGEDDNDNPTIPHDSIAVFDFYPDMYGRYSVTLEWAQRSDDLDLYVLDNSSNLMEMSATTGYPEELIFEAETGIHYTVVVHRYSAVSPQTDFTVTVQYCGEVTVTLLNPTNGSVVRNSVKVTAEIIIYGSATIENISIRLDDGPVIDITDYYDPIGSRLHYEMDISSVTDGIHRILLEVYYKGCGTETYRKSRSAYILADNTPSPILIIDDDAGGGFETYYISALEDMGCILHDDFEVWNMTVTSRLLKSFNIVIWLTGNRGNIDSGEFQAIIDYLDSGGNMFISSRDLADQWNNSMLFHSYMRASLARSTIAGEYIKNIVFFDDVEGGNIGWTTTGGWYITDTDYHSYNHSWYTGPYSNNADWSLESPLLDLSNLRNVTLSFWTHYSIESGYDFGYVEVSSDGGSSWTRIDSFTGLRTSWTMFTYNITSYVSSQFKIRFRLRSDYIVTDDGWWIDDIRIVGYACLPPPVNGTAGSLYGLKSYTLYGSDSSNTSVGSDALFVLDDAVPQMIYNGSTYYAALSYDGVYRLVYFAFPFESVNGSLSRMEIMNATLRFLNISGVPVSIDAPDTISVVVFSDVNIEVRLTSGGSPLSGREVYFYIRLGDGWHLIGSNTTDSDGYTLLCLENVSYSIGPHRLAVVFKGDTTYRKEVRFVSLNVRRRYTRIEVLGPTSILDSGEYILVHVEDEYGNPYITMVSIVVGDHRFEGLTNSSGIAKIWVSLPPGTYSARAIAHETEYNSLNETIFTLTIIDDDDSGPMVEVLEYPTEIKYYNDMTIRVKVTDTSGVLAVYLYYSINNAEYSSIPMRYVGDDIWEATIHGEELTYGTISWYVLAEDADSDTVGDKATTASSTYTTQIIDNTPPTILGYSITPESPREGDEITIRAMVYEPEGASGVKYVKMIISGPQGRSEIDASFDGTQYYVVLGDLKRGNYTCEIVASDNAGNDVSIKFSFEVRGVGMEIKPTKIPPWVFWAGLIVAVVIVVAISIYMIKLRRMRE